MAFTDTEAKRIENIETKLNEIQVALNALATTRSVKNISALLQNQINEVEDLANQIELTGSGPALETHKTADDHTSYHIDARGDVRYYTRAEISIISSGINHGDLDNIGVDDHHAQVHTHDDRYYTETEANTLISGVNHGDLENLDEDDHSIYHTDARGDARYYTQVQVDTIASGVNHGDLENVGTDDHHAEVHNHGSIYYTETELDTGQLDNRYYTETEIDIIASGINHGDLENIDTDDHHAEVHTHDSRYYTEGEVDTIASGINHGDLENSATGDDHTQYLLVDGSRPIAVSLSTIERDDLTPEEGMVIRNTASGFQGYHDSDWRKLDQDFEPFTTLTPAGTTQTVDFDTRRNQTIDLVDASGDVTLTLSNPVEGVVYILKIIQGATPRDIVWPGNVLWSEGTAPVISTTDDDMDIIQLLYDGTNYFGMFVQEFS